MTTIAVILIVLAVLFAVGVGIFAILATFANAPPPPAATAAVPPNNKRRIFIWCAIGCGTLGAFAGLLVAGWPVAVVGSPVAFSVPAASPDPLLGIASKVDTLLREQGNLAATQQAILEVSRTSAQNTGKLLDAQTRFLEVLARRRGRI